MLNVCSPDRLFINDFKRIFDRVYQSVCSKILVRSRFILKVVIHLLVAIALTACHRPPKLNELDGFAEGTTYHITWWNTTPVDLTTVSWEIDKALQDIDREISTYRADSILQKFNHSPSTDWQLLPASTIQLLQIAIPVYRDSNHCYDPTISPLFDLWGFQNDKPTVPTPQEIVEVKKGIGFDKLVIDAQHHRVRKTISRLEVDLSSIGEGYSIWRLSHVLEQFGIRNYIVEFGGDMLVKGHKPGDVKWRIAITRPVSGQLAAQQLITVDNETGISINTSGTYRRFFDANGKAYSHIIDPRTGQPVTHNLLSATVIDTDPRVGDAWATAMLCMGEREGDVVAKLAGIKVLFIRDENGMLMTTESPALQKSKDVTITAAD